jgi:hypothetical protein
MATRDLLNYLPPLVSAARFAVAELPSVIGARDPRCPC